MYRKIYKHSYKNTGNLSNGKRLWLVQFIFLILPIFLKWWWWVVKFRNTDVINDVNLWMFVIYSGRNVSWNDGAMTNVFIKNNHIHLFVNNNSTIFSKSFFCLKKIFHRKKLQILLYIIFQFQQYSPFFIIIVKILVNCLSFRERSLKYSK